MQLLPVVVCAVLLLGSVVCDTPTGTVGRVAEALIQAVQDNIAYTEDESPSLAGSAKETPYIDSYGISWFTEEYGSFTLDLTGDASNAIVCPGVGSKRVRCTVSPEEAQGQDDIQANRFHGNPSTHSFEESTFFYSARTRAEDYTELDVTYTMTDDQNCIILATGSDVAGASLTCVYGDADEDPTVSTVTPYAIDTEGTPWYNQEEGSFETTVFDYDDEAHAMLCPGAGSVRVQCEAMGVTAPDSSVPTDWIGVMGLYEIEVSSRCLTDAEYVATTTDDIIGYPITETSTAFLYSFDLVFDLDKDTHCLFIEMDRDRDTDMASGFACTYSAAADPPTGDKPFNLALVIGVAVGVVVLLGVAVALVLVVRKRNAENSPKSVAVSL
ncbi:hypothetical protein KIPB_003812 [Kipferlia bialata]|uniref:Ig-like domain-containing protein n=1 Tax=Kipferlia bialata TaxID=797122 RepID=A0A9K3CUP1_9EUKA|nr:hypothetical protein KIPB_003812 [Kipferlia bialata]|eukprot:g3812.t1